MAESGKEIETRPDAANSTKSVNMASSGLQGMLACRFDGRGSVSRFFDDFNRYARLNACNDDQKLNLLPLCLSGIARDAFDALSETQKGTFTNAEAGLKKSFSGGSSVDCLATLRGLL